MAIKLQGLEFDLKINTKEWDAGFKGAVAITTTLIASVAALGAGIVKITQKTLIGQGRWIKFKNHRSNQ